ncbi:hypothetical protein GVI59_18510 [Acetobacter sicerae]|nr:hypothetical protein [Acetobacter sicerae]
MPAIEASIRAIGTPVDSSVPVVGSVAPWQAEAAENGRGWTILHPYGMGAKRHSVNLVRQSNHLAALAETQAETDRRAAAVIAAICRDVSELPDRTSTDDDPSMMTVTQEELELIVRRNILSGAAS